MLRDHAAVHGHDRRRSPPREGPALLQGMVICGKCGRRMTVRSHQSRGPLVPIDPGQREGIQHEADCAALDDEQRARMVARANDVPRLWRDRATPDRERKRMLRLILDDVTLIKGKDLVVHGRFRGGATRTLTLPRPAPAWALRQTSADVGAEIDRLLAEYPDVPIARMLTEHEYEA